MIPAPPERARVLLLLPWSQRHWTVHQAVTGVKMLPPLASVRALLMLPPSAIIAREVARQILPELAPRRSASPIPSVSLMVPVLQKMPVRALELPRQPVPVSPQLWVPALLAMLRLMAFVPSP